MNTDQYIEMLQILLNNMEHYTKLSFDPTNNIMNIIKVMVSKALAIGILDQNTAKFLQNQYPCIQLYTHCQKS